MYSSLARSSHLQEEFDKLMQSHIWCKSCHQYENNDASLVQIMYKSVGLFRTVNCYHHYHLTIKCAIYMTIIRPYHIDAILGILSLSALIEIYSSTADWYTLCNWYIYIYIYYIIIQRVTRYVSIGVHEWCSALVAAHWAEQHADECTSHQFFQ